MKKKTSVAHRNVLILLFSLLPFFIGIGFSIAKSANMEYFGAAINISGSQRMRTMLIANYAQQIEDSYNSGNLDELEKESEILANELVVYEKYMDALYNGSEELGLIPNGFHNITDQIKSYDEIYKLYVKNAKVIIEDPSRGDVVDEIVAISLPLKNEIHQVVQLYQVQYDEDLAYLKKIDIAMIFMAISVTGLGLLLTRSIKRHEYFANYDHLTGLLTRYNMYENIVGKDSNEHAVFFIDLNKFKIINDTFGHAIGDEILIEVAKRLTDVFGAHHVYRFGGDEFVVIIKSNLETNEMFLDEYVFALRRAISAPIVDSHAREHFVGLSLGAVSSHVGFRKWDEVIHFADELMYDAKSVADHIVLCKTTEDAWKRLNVVENIEESLVNGDFRPHFQSIFNVETQKHVMNAVLSKWYKTEERTIEPSEFLPMLKRKGLLDKFDQYILLELDKNYQKFPEHEKDILYSVNLTEETLIRAKYNGLYKTLDSLSIPSEKLVLKFLEDVLIHEEIMETMEHLSSMGYILAIDNFTIDLSLKESTKYKNIGIVKLGKTTMTSLLSEQYSRKILKEFIHMLISIGKIVIVEGVESEMEAAILKQINSELESDLLYSTPLTLRTIDDLEAL